MLIHNIPGLWSGLCRARWGCPGDCPGLAGEGRGMPGEAGQVEAAGEVILCDWNGLPSVCPAKLYIKLS